MALITLTTDFGVENWFSGTMKGVIKNICPTAEIVDISHSIRRFNVYAGAFTLKNAYCFFPEGAIHVVVVDPGVGSDRPAILVKTDKYFFIAPDNGVLSYALQQENVEKIISIENEKFFLSPVSSTFHGRDIFSPVAAYLAAGIAIDELGPEVEQIKHLTRSVPHPLSAREILGHVLYVDNFGNCISNISRSCFEELVSKSTTGSFKIAVRDREITRISSSYSDGRSDEPVVVIGSSGYLEIAVNQGSAAETVGLNEGMEIIIKV